MGRKNASVRRTNARGRIARGELREKATHRYVPPPIDQVVVPDGACTRPRANGRPGKPRFDTAEKARAALIQAQRKRHALGSGHVEKRFYDCPFCPGFHLTSSEIFNGKRVTS